MVPQKQTARYRCVFYSVTMPSYIHTEISARAGWYLMAYSEQKGYITPRYFQTGSLRGRIDTNEKCNTLLLNLVFVEIIFSGCHRFHQKSLCSQSLGTY